ncbi:ABC-type transport auxiliary lipoprotein family protein [Helicobacter cetorum]|uniref:ABC-type transport auxiliary lipoprotein family protein n=1 Tax=Helicobacter cetorum TaxID=138563 RepID=UPI000CF10FD5|nr:ABC-type transport auxiliary lipoprotein family protein [Helicobacter cetorum]
MRATYLKLFSLSLVLALILGGCLNLNLRQVLPEIKNYDLNASSFAKDSCAKQVAEVGLVSILSVDLFNTKEIVFKAKDGQITYGKHQKWVDLPRNMLKTMFMQEAQKACLSVALPPYGMKVPPYSVRFTILSFSILEEDNAKYKAEFALGYDISVKGYSHSGVIIKHEGISNLENKTINVSKDSKDKENKQDFQESAIQSLQHVSEQAVQEAINLLKKAIQEQGAKEGKN